MFRFSYKKGIAVLVAFVLSGTIIASAEPSQPDEEPSDVPVITVSSEAADESETSSEALVSSEPSSPSAYISSTIESTVSESSPLVSVTSSDTVHSNFSASTSSKSAAVSSRPSQPKPTISPEWNDNLNEILNNASDWLKNNEEGSMYFIALGSAGKSVGSQRYEILFNQIANLNSDQTSLYDISLFALNSTFCGVNATRVRNRNLIELISGYPSLDLHDTTTLIYTLLAFDSNQYADDLSASVNRETLLELLLARQQENGAFLAAEGENTVELTALALAALSGYADRTAVRAAHSRGLEYIRTHYTTASLKSETSDVFSQIIIAMNCLGINVNDTRFMKSNQNIDDILLDYLGEDGGFKQKLQDSFSSTRSTELAVIALSSIKYFANPYVLRQNLADASSAASAPSPFSRGSLSLNWVWLVIPALILIGAGVSVSILIYRKKRKAASFSDDSTE